MKGRNRLTKTQCVLDHLKEHGSITSWEAIEKYGATRLSAIIYNLRKHYRIEGVDHIVNDRFGNASTYTRYIYCGERQVKQMGKNHGKKKAKTDLARWTSIMRKLDNQLAKQELERQKRRAEKKSKTSNE